MDFESYRIEGQEEFRKGVQAWLEANLPPKLEKPEDDENTPYELYQLGLDWRRKLGQKGWLQPTYPKQYGGGGLSADQATIIAEETALREERVPPSWGDSGQTFIIPAIMVWGTEEQKQRFLPPMCLGEWVTWQGFTEPGAGSDLASVNTKATRDGDDYILNGEKCFIGGKFGVVDYIFTLTVTDPSAPRHRNLGVFMVPAHLPGITLVEQHTMGRLGGSPPPKYQIYYENVRVPASHLIGAETNGWQVTQSALEMEHGGGGGFGRRDRLFERVVGYCKETQRHGQPLSQDPDVQRELVEVYIQEEIGRLFNLRNYWMRHAKKRGAGYEGSQSSLWGKTIAPKIGAAYLRILGPAALTNDPKWAILRGALEFHQRNCIVTHPGGTREVQKVVIGRRIGVSRTRETAAPTA